jgi:hypothetical protein
VPTVSPKEAVQTVSWSSSNNAVATVQNGRVTARGYGTATITVASVDDPGKRAACVVTVRAPVYVSSVTLNPDPVVVFAGETDSKAAGYMIYPGAATNRNAAITVSPSGVATAAFNTSAMNYISISAGKTSGAGKLTIMTEDGGKTAAVDVIVVDKQEPTLARWLTGSTTLYSKLGTGTASSYGKDTKLTILGTVSSEWYYVQTAGGVKGFIRRTVGLIEVKSKTQLEKPSKSHFLRKKILTNHECCCRM